MKTLSKLQQLSFIIRREFLAISTSYAVLLVLMGGIFVYGLLYNYMYAPNIVTDVPVAVVDNSHSELSRDFIRWLDATPQAEIFSQAMDYHEAKEWMKEGKVQGILYLPHDFEERVFRGDEAVFSLYATTDAFLYFEALQGASTFHAGNTRAKTKSLSSTKSPSSTRLLKSRLVTTRTNW